MRPVAILIEVYGLSEKEANDRFHDLCMKVGEAGEEKKRGAWAKVSQCKSFNPEYGGVVIYQP